MRNRYLFLADLLVLTLAVWGAFGVRFGWLVGQNQPEFTLFLAIALAVKIVAFHSFGLYRRYWRYAGYWDVVAVVLANSAASALLMMVMVGLRLSEVVDGLSRVVLAVDWLLAVVMTVGCRASVRAVAEAQPFRRSAEKPMRHVLIVGAGDAGTLVAREMQRNRQLGLQPIGFLDDAPGKVNQTIYGLEVLGQLSALSTVAAARRVDEVVIAIPTAGGAAVRAVAEQCRALGIASRVVPGIHEVLDGQVSISRLRQLEIADLLRRPQVVSDSGGSEYVRGLCVAVTGAGGSIGSELCRQLAHAGPAAIVLVGHGENSLFQIAAELRTRFPSVLMHVVLADVRDLERLTRVFREHQPAVVFHAAAHKHVPLMEDNAAEAVTNNVLGTRNVVEAAMAVGVQRFVMVSTDKAVAPSSIMGASKRIAEQIVQRAARTHGVAYVVVRFGNVLNSRGSVVPTFKAQIERGGPVTVTHPEVRRFFMTIAESVHLVLQAGGIGQGGELFVLDMGEPVLLREMAADMIRLSGLDESEVPIVFTGLRPGEKLDEVLWEEGAAIHRTARADIRRVVETASVSHDRLEDLVSRLASAATRDDRERIVRIFQEAIPSAVLTKKSHAPTTLQPGVVVSLPGA